MHIDGGAVFTHYGNGARDETAAAHVRRQVAHLHADRDRDRRHGERSSRSPCRRTGPLSGFALRSAPRPSAPPCAARFFSRISSTRSYVSTSAIDGQSAATVFPARRPHAEPLAEQADEDARLVLAEAGQREHAREQLVAGRARRSRRSRRGRRSCSTRIRRERVRPLGHRARVAVQRGLGPEHRFELVGRRIAAIAAGVERCRPAAPSTARARRTPTPSAPAGRAASRASARTARPRAGDSASVIGREVQAPPATRRDATRRRPDRPPRATH